MKQLSILALAALALAACAPDGPPAEPQQVVASNGDVAICNDNKLETSWETAAACGDNVYTAPGKGAKIWVDPEFKCEYYLSEFYDGSQTRYGPGAPRMAVINNEYVHVCRELNAEQKPESTASQTPK